MKEIIAAKKGDVAASFEYPVSFSQQVLDTVKNHRLLYPDCDYEFRLVPYVIGDKFVHVDVIAKIDNPAIDPERFKVLFEAEDVKTVIKVRLANEAKDDTLAYIERRSGDAIELLYPWVGKSRAAICHDASAIASKYNVSLWSVESAWRYGKLYFFPNLKHVLYPGVAADKDIYVISQLLGKIDLPDLGILTWNEEDVYSASITWLSYVYAEATAYEEMLNSLVVAHINKEDFAHCYAKVNAFLDEKMQTISLFDDNDVGLWTLTQSKLSLLSLLAN